MLLLIPFVDLHIYFYYFLVAFFPEVLRTLYLGTRRCVEGCGLIVLGWVVFAGACVFQALIELGHLKFEFIWFPYIVGILVLLVCMSAYLARSVARTNRDLEAQLEQVKRLSDQTLAQERRAREEAIAREHLEAENVLKTAQLEAAHERQKVLDELERTNVELRHTQASLVQSAKMAALGKLVAGITHEINSPVGAIRSTVDTLGRALAKLRDPSASSDRDGAAPEADRAFDVVAQSSGVIGDAAERITGIVGNLRNFARLDEAEFQIANLEEGLDSTLAVMDIGENITITKKYAGVDPVYCSPGQLNNVFMHLITNACQAVGDEGTIALTTFQDDTHVNVQIGDSGRGIPVEQLAQIFDFDFRAGASRVKMGMGLVADYNVVQALHGELAIESQVGVGTQVTVRLPRRARDPGNAN
jgi:signal transduction histidine kinase